MVNEEQPVVAPSPVEATKEEPERQIMVCAGEVDEGAWRLITAHRGGLVQQICATPSVYLVMFPLGVQIGNASVENKQTTAILFPSLAYLIMNRTMDITKSWIHLPYTGQRELVEERDTSTTPDTGTDAP